MYGDGQAEGKTGELVGIDRTDRTLGGTSVLWQGQRGSGATQTRPAVGASVPEILQARVRTSEHGSGRIFPAAAHRLFRGDRLGTRDRVAGGGVLIVAGVSRFQRDRTDAGPFDHLADAAAVACGNTPGGVPVVCPSVGRRRLDRG